MNFINKIWKGKGWFFITAILLVLVNWLASVYHARIDLTNEKRFTLSAATKKILRNLDDQVEVKVFLKGDFPSGFKKLANNTQETLEEFQEASSGKLKYNFVSPDELMDDTEVKWGDTLSAMGLYPINLKSQLKKGEQQQLVYPVALLRYKEKVLPVKLYNGIPNIGRQEINSAEALMEFQLADGIYKLSGRQKPMIAYSIGNGEPQDARTYDLVENVLRADYDLKLVNINKAPVIDDTFKLMMIVKPVQPFTEIEKLRIDQYIMRGGKLLMFIDALNAEMDSLRIKNEVIAYERGLGLTDLLFKYGARINNDLVMDLQSDKLPFDVNGNGQFEFLSWNYFPVFISKSDHAINKNLGFVSGRFVNSIDTVEAAGISKTVLLSSSANARSISAPALISGSENVNAPEDEKFKTPDIPVAVLLDGKFTSMFKNRLSQELNDSLEKYGEVFQPQNISGNKMILVSDGDIVLNSVARNEPLPMGMNPFTVGSQYEFSFANRDFLTNCLDFLINQSGLAEAKAKDYSLMLLDTKKLEAQKLNWQLLNIAAPVFLVILFALLFQWLRKRKYSKKYI
ncbi:MAG: gliding motility-associated ABC transporter substrate-binding protein GldG [Ferruginibacter sp.]|nr:gliding motility-associated ABC transporter substrate-binding protein GldG [Ferruginibacter sp.]